MKKLNLNFTSATFALALLSGSTHLQADSPTETFSSTGTSLLKSSNWSGGTTPVGNVIGSIAVSGTPVASPTSGPIGWNNSTNPGASTFGTVDLVAGASYQVVGNYTSKTSNSAVNITLAGATLNNVADTIIANSSGTAVLFQNDIVPVGDNSVSALTTYTLGNPTNVIQATTGSNIIIDNVITGTGDSLTFLGSGSSTTAGATLELGAGSANDVTGGAAANAPVPANTGFAANTGTVQTADVNSFTGGLIVGNADGTQAGTVQVDGANALPKTGNVTVNANSQLTLKGSATYGASSQTVTLSGANGQNSSTLATGTSDNSVLATGLALSGASDAVNVQGTSSLTVSGQVSGSGQLQAAGSGTLTLSNANIYSGGTVVSGGSLVSANSTALGTSAVAVTGGKLSSSITTSTAIGGNLSMSSGSIVLNSGAMPTFALALGNYTMSGGTLSLTYNLGTAGSIASTGGTFSISGGTLNLNNSFTTAAYALSYDVLSGFTGGTVNALNITNYDTTDYKANLSDNGILSFTSNSVSAPEPTTWALLAGGLGLLVATRVRRNFIA